jgi:hypothetical protein
MPPAKLINAPYYNLINNTLLNPANITTYLIKPLIKSNFYTDPVFMLNPTPNIFNEELFIYDDIAYSIYNLSLYINKLINNGLITNRDKKILNRVLTKNSYNIKTLLINKVSALYYLEYTVKPISKAIAINKIKRNKIYNLGLGLKLAVKAYSKEF